MILHIPEQIKQSGPIPVSWTYFVERYIRFIRNAVADEQRTVKTMSIAHSRWLSHHTVFDEFGESPFSNRSDYGLRRASVVDHGKWTVWKPKGIHRDAFFEATGDPELVGAHLSQLGVFLSGPKITVNNQVTFQTKRSHRHNARAKASFVIILLEDGKDCVAEIGAIHKYVPKGARGRRRRNHKYAMFVYAKRTTVVDLGHGVVLKKVDIQTRANLGADPRGGGEYYGLSNVTLSNPILVPAMNWDPDIFQAVHRTYYVVDPKEPVQQWDDDDDNDRERNSDSEVTGSE